jgi:hypothetical protein
MVGNKKKTINITSKNTNNTEKQIVEAIMELPSIPVLDTDILDRDVLDTNNIDNTDSLDRDNTDATNVLNNDNPGTTNVLDNEGDNEEDKEDKEDKEDNEDKDEGDNEEDNEDTNEVLDELPNDATTLNALDTIELDELDTFDTVQAEDEIYNKINNESDYENYESTDEEADNVNECVEYNITEGNYCELPTLVVDYTKSPTAGIRAIVWAGEAITQYQGVEVFILDNQTYVRPFSSLSNSPFFGVAQHDANIGEDVAVTTSGITKIQVSKTINLPYLVRSGNQCVFAKNQKNGV